MEIRALHSHYLDNENAVELENKVFTSREGEIYEVLRIIDGIPLFIEDHTRRFFNSAALADIDTGLSALEIEKRIRELIAVNHAFIGNIRFSYFNRFYAFFIPHKYPDENEYRDGVPCGLLRTERINRQAKTFQENIREATDQLIKKQNLYEVLLVDNEGNITEGSRSNVFFIKGKQFFTTPAADVLPGTTRKRIISLIGKLKLHFTEERIGLPELSGFEAAFISGTSPRILPVKKIDDYSFRTDHQLMRFLMGKYDDLVIRYLQEKKQSSNIC